MHNTVVTLNVNNVMCGNAVASHLHACNRWECNYVVINENLYEKCYPSWNKFHILENLPYDRVLFLDSDTLVHSTCPNPFSLTGDFIAVRDNHEQYFNDPVKLQNYTKDFITPHYNYLTTIHPPAPDQYVYDFFNSGVMLFYPHMMSQVIEPYHRLINDNIANGTSHREQAIVNYIVQREFNITYLDRKWNVIEPIVSKEMDGNIYHFTGNDTENLKEAIRTYDWR